MSRFAIGATPLVGLRTVSRTRLTDSRGSFQRIFCASELEDCGWSKPIRQMNIATTAQRGGVRGMHYQLPPAAEAKLVTCIDGEVWDVAVDLRTGSPTFLSWHAEQLSAENGLALLIPEGFAHGFQVLSPGATLLYCHSADWTPNLERGVRPTDARIGIDWPLPPSDMSERDATRDLLSDDFTGVAL